MAMMFIKFEKKRDYLPQIYTYMHYPLFEKQTRNLCKKKKKKSPRNERIRERLPEQNARCVAMKLVALMIFLVTGAEEAAPKRRR